MNAFLFVFVGGFHLSKTHMGSVTIKLVHCYFILFELGSICSQQVTLPQNSASDGGAEFTTDSQIQGRTAFIIRNKTVYDPTSEDKPTTEDDIFNPSYSQETFTNQFVYDDSITDVTEPETVIYGKNQKHLVSFLGCSIM